MGGELTDSDLEILANRPQNIDNLIVIAQNTTSTQQYLVRKHISCFYNSGTQNLSIKRIFDKSVFYVTIKQIFFTNCHLLML